MIEFKDEPLIAFRTSGELAPGTSTPAASPTAPLSASQSDAQAKIDSILADKAHPFHRGDPQSVDLILELTRTALGPAGRQIVCQIGTPAPDADRSAAAAADALPPSAAVSSDPVSAEVASAHTEADILGGMAADSLVAAAPTLGEHLGVVIDPQHARSIVASLQPRPDGFPMRIEDELQHYPEDARNELEELHGIGWTALKRTDGFPLSAEAEDDRHGYRFHPKAFGFLVELGAHVREQQEAEALRLHETRPGDARTNDPGRRR